MTASQIRAKARENLKGKWGKAAVYTLAFFVVELIISFILTLTQKSSDFVYLIFYLCYAVISVPLAYGLIATFINLKREENVGYFYFLTEGFSKFKEAWLVGLRIIVKLIGWLLLALLGAILMTFGTIGSIFGSSSLAFIGLIGFIAYIAGIIILVVKSYYYAITYYLLFDNSDMPATDIVDKSKELMTGHRWELFYLFLTFIGWAILSVLTLGIGLFFLVPYIQISTVIFYENLQNETPVKKQDSSDGNEEPIKEG